MSKPKSLNIGNMSAKMDPKTSVIRLTSKEKGSPLKENGFMVNIHPGSKEHELLVHMMGGDNAAETVSLIDKIQSSKNREQKIRMVIESREWDVASAHYREMTYLVLKELMHDFTHSPHSQSDGLWVENFAEYLNPTAEEFYDRLEERVIPNETATFGGNAITEKIHAAHDEYKKGNGPSRSISVLHIINEIKTLVSDLMQEVREEVWRKLPHEIRLSDKYRSSDPLMVPLGVNVNKDVIHWNLHMSSHFGVEGVTGSGYSVIVPLVLHHVFQHRKTSQAFVLKGPIDDVTHGIPMAGESIRAASSWDNAVSLLGELNELLAQRLEYLNTTNRTTLHEELHEGELRRTFVVIPDLFSLTREASLAGKDLEELILPILRKGRVAGIHVVISSRTTDNDSLTAEMRKNILAMLSLRGIEGLDHVSSGQGLFAAPGDDNNQPVSTCGYIERAMSLFLPF